MKAVLIIHNEAIDRDVTEAIESLGLRCYTKFTQVLGRGEKSEPHLGSDVWPGTNHATLVVTEDSKAGQVMGLVRQMRERLGAEGLKAFVWSIEDAT